MDEDMVDQISDIDNVISVQKTTQTQYTGDSLESGIESGSLGGRGQFPGGEDLPDGDFTMAISVMGFDPANKDPELMGDAHMEIVEGSYFTTDQIDADVVVVGDALAEANELEVGDMIDIEGVSVEVIGIYDSGQVFGDNMLVMPIDTVQRLFELEGVTSATVIVDNVDNVEGVADDIRDRQGQSSDKSRLALLAHIKLSEPSICSL